MCSTFEESMELAMEKMDDLALVDLDEQITSNMICELFESCKSHCSIKYLSVLIDMTTRYFGITRGQCNGLLLSSMGGLTAESAHRLSEIFILGDADEFWLEGRDGKDMDGFYDHFPDIELEAKSF